MPRGVDQSAAAKRRDITAERLEAARRYDYTLRFTAPDCIVICAGDDGSRLLDEWVARGLSGAAALRIECAAKKLRGARLTLHEVRAVGPAESKEAQ